MTRRRSCWPVAWTEATPDGHVHYASCLCGWVSEWPDEQQAREAAWTHRAVSNIAREFGWDPHEAHEGLTDLIANGFLQWTAEGELQGTFPPRGAR